MASVYDNAQGKLPTWGKYFLTVQSVQELVKKQKETIPERYVRRELEERLTPTSMSDHQLDIPIIDMSKLLSEGLQREQEIKKIAQACEEWGFFQVSFDYFLLSCYHEQFWKKITKYIGADIYYFVGCESRYQELINRWC